MIILLAYKNIRLEEAKVAGIARYNRLKIDNIENLSLFNFQYLYTSYYIY